jgi:hypothetical protein
MDKYCSATRDRLEKQINTKRYAMIKKFELDQIPTPILKVIQEFKLVFEDMHKAKIAIPKVGDYRFKRIVTWAGPGTGSVSSFSVYKRHWNYLFFRKWGWWTECRIFNYDTDYGTTNGESNECSLSLVFVDSELSEIASLPIILREVLEETILDRRVNAVADEAAYKYLLAE